MVLILQATPKQHYKNKSKKKGIEQLKQQQMQRLLKHQQMQRLLRLLKMRGLLLMLKLLKMHGLLQKQTRKKRLQIGWLNNKDSKLAKMLQIKLLQNH